MGNIDLVKQAQMDLLAELDRICKKWDIPYFLTAGTLIGAVRHSGFIPWDDDLDTGLLRKYCDRLEEACKQDLDPNYYLHSWKTDPASPHCFYKLKIKGTHYPEEIAAGTKMDDGIFIDIFPFDRIPSGRKLQAFHRAECAWFISAFSLYPFWQRRQEIPREKSLYYRKSFVSRAVLGVLYRLTTREWLYRKMCREMGWFNGDERCTLVNVVRLPLDVMTYESAKECVEAPFGRLSICVPRDLEAYLHHHYPVLVKHIPDEQKVTHAPLKLSFDTLNEQTYE